jgi:outer membrane assembly lipoprotein YfiO
MIILVDALAANEMHVARYYMKRKAYLAAANRAQAAIREFSNTPYVEEALALMATAYTELDLKPLADDSRRVLAQNHQSPPLGGTQNQPETEKMTQGCGDGIKPETAAWRAGQIHW